LATGETSAIPEASPLPHTGDPSTAHGALDRHVGCFVGLHPQPAVHVGGDSLEDDERK